MLNSLRLLTTADNYFGGRDPSKIYNQVVILFVDPQSLSSLQELQQQLEDFS